MRKVSESLGVSTHTIADIYPPSGSKRPKVSEEMLPRLPPSRRIYSIMNNTTSLYWHHIPDCSKGKCSLSKATLIYTSWTECPDSSLLFSGGFNGRRPVDEAWRVDVKREFAVSFQASMICRRSDHSSCYFQGCVYAIGGFDSKTCERLSLQTGIWEALPDFPHEISGPGLVPVESTASLYVFGGRTRLDNEAKFTMYVLGVRSAVWTMYALKLPHLYSNVACFLHPSREDTFFFVSGSGLYKLNVAAHKLEFVRDLGKIVRSEIGMSWYFGGRLFGSGVWAANLTWELGSLC